MSTEFMNKWPRKQNFKLAPIFARKKSDNGYEMQAFGDIIIFSSWARITKWWSQKCDSTQEGEMGDTPL